MQRSSIIATVVAAGGVLVAGSVASVAVINAATTSQPPAQTMTIVADPLTAEPSAPAPAPDDAAPAIIALPNEPAQQSSGTAPAQTTSVQQVREVSSDKATRLVLRATGGGTPQSVSRASRGGYAAWKVRVQRADGSVVTGYVDRSSGVVFDWIVNQEAPAAQPAQPTADDPREDDRDDDEASDDEASDDGQYQQEQDHEDDSEDEDDD